MKKLGLFMLSFAMMGMLFSSCKKDKEKENLDNVIEDGFYCVGEATPVASIEAKNLQLALMGAGSNEVTKEKREGMYEKYVYLEANKDFSLVLHKVGQTDIVYGADLEEGIAITDNDLIEVKQFKGLLAENKKMQVKESGLYHIILDLDVNGDLASQGGKQIVVVACNWGMRGWKGDWGFQEMELIESTPTKMVYKYTPANGVDTILSAQSFKFAHSNCWKFQLDMGGQVKAENSIGTNAEKDGGEYTELLGGGKNIPVGRGVYDYVTLTWELTGGAVAKSFKFETHMSAALPAVDPGTFVVGISGSGLFGNSGNIPDWSDPQAEALAVYDAAASTVTDQASMAGTYVYKVSDLNFKAGAQFKFRCDGAWLNAGDVDIVGIQPSGNDNIEGVQGAYNIKFTLVWDGSNRTSLKAEFSAGQPAEEPQFDYVEGRVLVQDLSGQASINLYGWAPEESDNNDIFGAWPGLAENEKVTIDNVEYKVFPYTKAIKDAEYRFIVNASGWQTGDADWTVAMDGTDVYLKANADQTLELVVK